MVHLNRIYTKTGDDGTTGLASGQRVRKDDISVECYGTVDEANASIGLCVLAADQTSDVDMASLLRSIQHDLFDLGADLATPIKPNETPGTALRILDRQTLRLEASIDSYNEKLSPLTSFVLPGGSTLAAHLHHARAVVRRAERLAVTLKLQRDKEVSFEPVRYLNRLSDLLFVLSRAANENGKRDVLWVPGKNRRM